MCRNEEACLGRNPPTNDPKGDCAEGYEGILCSDCEFGYSRQGSNFLCARCPPVKSNIIRLIGLFVVLILALIILIRSNLRSASKEKSNFTVFIRIMVNHFQLLTLTASFDLEWPLELQRFFSSFKPVSELSTQLLSADCFLDSRVYELDADTNLIKVKQEGLRIFYQRLVILGSSPIIVVVTSFVVWNLIYWIQD